jgi:hypothetical protein
MSSEIRTIPLYTSIKGMRRLGHCRTSVFFIASCYCVMLMLSSYSSSVCYLNAVTIPRPYPPKILPPCSRSGCLHQIAAAANTSFSTAPRNFR